LPLYKALGLAQVRHRLAAYLQAQQHTANPNK
jgi:hypothetical protein